MNKNLISLSTKAAAILAAAMLVPSTAVTASPRIMPDGQTFDAAYYAVQNPDVTTIVGTDENALYAHYVAYGKAEGRAAYAATENAIEDTSAAPIDITSSILALQTILPEGTPWTNEANAYANVPVWGLRGRGCAAFAMQVSDAVYGMNTGVTRLLNQAPDAIQSGDVVRIGGTHSVVVLSAGKDSITVCEGNYNSMVHWGRVISKQSLNGQISYIARRG